MNINGYEVRVDRLFQRIGVTSADGKTVASYDLSEEYVDLDIALENLTAELERGVVPDYIA